jgi:hypothetical protein
MNPVKGARRWMIPEVPMGKRNVFSSLWDVSFTLWVVLVIVGFVYTINEFVIWYTLGAIYLVVLIFFEPGGGE